MAWSTDRSALKTAIENLSYKLAPENKDVRDLKNLQNKIFSIRFIGLGSVELMTASKINYSHAVEIELGYVHNDDTQKATNETNFITIIETIAALSAFENFTEIPKFEKLDDKHSVGRILMHFGMDNN